MKKLAIYTILGCTAFLAVFWVRLREGNNNPTSVMRAGADAPDSVQLAELGIWPGNQLVVFVFGGSRCGFCQKPETKRAFAALRDSMSLRYVRSGAYQAVSVIGVAVNTDLHEGLAYLKSIGDDAFDQISVGSGWQNELIVRLTRRERIAEPAIPLIVVVSRSLTASLSPLKMTYGADSVLKVVQGATRIAEWMNDGMALTGSSSKSAPQGLLQSGKELLSARSSFAPSK